MHDTHEVAGSNPVSPTTFQAYFKRMSRPRSKIEWIVIIGLTLLFGSIWLFAHWNLSRKPPHHKGPGSAGYVESTPPPSSTTD